MVGGKCAICGRWSPIFRSLGFAYGSIAAEDSHRPDRLHRKLGLSQLALLNDCDSARKASGTNLRDRYNDGLAAAPDDNDGKGVSPLGRASSGTDAVQSGAPHRFAGERAL